MYEEQQQKPRRNEIRICRWRGIAKSSWIACRRWKRTKIMRKAHTQKHLPLTCLTW